ncbi:hypothetical protein C474_12005 [Halogeometricum pallidum JCM 14848]|uniref:LVIVD repeat-containing protein n=1 Tax=Halogeometricum pallidum JCM 14848 TaxID=1227487 RepID=M0D3T1_HALPD|nr:hypothetical protein [Halogeometricum pallidum]ELZ30085.1 hypothetical protein C474_12005 [Halogeometricum pallidum JCM 14848]
MRRRDFLRTGALVGATGLLSAAATPTAAHPGPYQPYGRVDVAGTKEAVTSPDGSVAYLATGTGYATVDVSVPDRPELLADVRGPLADHEAGPLRGIYDVKLDATDPETLVVVGPANPLPGAVAGALVVDVSDPAAPERVAFHETDFPIHNCFVRDGLAYLTKNDGETNALAVLDIDSGETLSEWTLTGVDGAWADVRNGRRAVHDVFVGGDTAYVAHWDAGTWILDVSDPTNPTHIGGVEVPDPAELAASNAESRREGVLPPGNHHYVATDESGTLLGVGKESWAQRIGGGDEGADGTGESRLVGGPSGIDLWDVSDPAAPRRLSTIDPPPSPDPTYGGVWTTAHNFEFADGRLYSSWYRGGVKRHDVSDPRNPEPLSWWRMPDEASFWTARLARPGAQEGFFVGASRGVGDVPGRLYTFPDHAGQQASPPSLTSASAATETESPVATATSEGSTGGTAAATGEPDEPDESDDGASASAPGFGAGAAAGALGLASWRLLRRARRK